MADRTDKEIQWLLDLQPLLKPSFNLADWETRDGGTMIMLYRLDGNGNPGTLYRGHAPRSSGHGPRTASRAPCGVDERIRRRQAWRTHGLHTRTVRRR